MLVLIGIIEMMLRDWFHWESSVVFLNQLELLIIWVHRFEFFWIVLCKISDTKASLAKEFLQNEIVYGSYWVVTIISNIPLSLLLIDFFVFRYLRNYVHIDRYWVLSNVDAMELPYFGLFVPRMCPDPIDWEPFGWICAEYFSYKVFTLVANKFRDWVLCIENLLI